MAGLFCAQTKARNALCAIAGVGKDEQRLRDATMNTIKRLKTVGVGSDSLSSFAFPVLSLRQWCDEPSGVIC